MTSSLIEGDEKRIEFPLEIASSVLTGFKKVSYSGIPAIYYILPLIFQCR